MRRSRFSLNPKSNVTMPPPPGAQKKRVAYKKAGKQELMTKTNITDPIPLPVLDKLVESRNATILDIEEEEEEEMFEYEEELDSLAGLTRKELLNIYRIEYNTYLNNIDRVSSIIEDKLTAI